MRTKIIVELCQNHAGDRGILRDMIAAASEAGADYVKGQVIFSDDVAYRARFEEGHLEENGVRKAIKRPHAAEVERLKKLDLTEDDMRFFVEESVRQGVTPIVTVFTRKRVPFTAALKFPERTVKVASPDCVSLPFLRELCDAFDHLIISTGGATDEEIARAAQTVKAKGKKATFLHCVSIYPNALDFCNLSRMEHLKTFSQQTGWSDHTRVAQDGIKAAKVAVFLDADYIERHFTILPEDKTKDGPVSITPALLAELVAFTKFDKDEQKRIIENEIPEWRALLGVPQRHMTHHEALNIDYFRGRFASKAGDRWVFNWEDTPLF